MATRRTGADPGRQSKAPAKTPAFRAPRLDYRPPAPRSYSPGIGLVGCGGITESHLKAYSAAGYRVLAFCDADPARARARRDAFYPDADILPDHHALLSRQDIQVVDVATHPRERLPIIEDALRAGRHVLSQKPFVTDLAEGERLADLADTCGVRLAVNQNGRWAPYFSYMRQAVARGLVGEPYAVHLACHWSHEWIRDTPFNGLYHAVLYDFAIHWFDIARVFLGGRSAGSVYATLTRAPGQGAKPPLLAEVVASFGEGQVSLVFDGCTRGPSHETAVVVGTGGVLSSDGPLCGASSVRLATPQGTAVARLAGSWFPDGFGGTMGELLCAIEEGRAPTNSARDNLGSLALCFAAVASADTGQPQEVGSVRTLPLDRCSIAP
jgi:predicted dehydrogenase